MSAEAFGHCEFPVGDLSKTEVRRLAREFALPVHDKRDSTGICFIGERPFGEFLAQYLPAMPGPIETPEGARLGMHRGLMYYTLGQRQGLALGGVRGAAEAPWYVAAKDLDRNRLIVVQDAAHPLLTSDRAPHAGRALDRGISARVPLPLHRQAPLSTGRSAVRDDGARRRPLRCPHVDSAARGNARSIGRLL